MRAWFDRVLTCPWETVARVIPDEQHLIEAALIELCDVEGCSLVVTRRHRPGTARCHP